MTSDISLTAEEQGVLDMLVESWNRFVSLPSLHSADKHEVMHAIHAAQNIILSRLYLRGLLNTAMIGEEKRNENGDWA